MDSPWPLWERHRRFKTSLKTSSLIHHSNQVGLIEHLSQLSWSFLLFLLLAYVPHPVKANRENCVQSPSRPFYLIGHMTNSVDDVKRFLEEGANALEIDVQFDEDGLIESIYHGIPCDCFR